jgi:hypothetical protein
VDRAVLVLEEDLVVTLPTLFSITCEGGIDFSCDLPRVDEEGIFVCRTYTHSVSGETNMVPVCIPTDKAFESDECGCCGEVCPTECDSCPCELPFNGPDGVPKEGVAILAEGMYEPWCVPKFESWMMMWRDDELTCNTECN